MIDFCKSKLFNNNIRCIEIDLPAGGTAGRSKFNNNIRCIEMEQKKYKI